MKLKKIFLSLGVMFTMVFPITTVISCSSSSNIVNHDYDLGLATSSINSLNYVKNKNTFIIIPSMIDGLVKKTPRNQNLVNYLDIPELKIDLWIEKEMRASNSFWRIKQYFAPGVLHSSSGNRKAIVANQNSENSRLYSKIGFQLNEGLSKWSNGKKVKAQDFVDTVKYILDLNTGSQLLETLLDLKIKNSQKIYNLQIQYSQKFKKTYNDPFGYYGGFESQNKGDEDYVKKIKEAVEGLGYYTGLNPKFELAKNKEFFGSIKKQVSNEYKLFLEFEDSNPVAYSNVTRIIFGTQMFLPVNREFIESHGGIHKFGIDKETFIWNGPFDPEDISLGPQGHIVLKKNYKYYSAKKTISNKIKILFQDNPVITAAMFEDGYIGKTNVPISYMMKFWSDPKKRQFMKKNIGFGTIAFSLNLDKETNTNKALLNADFRKAINYAIDRNAILKIVGWDMSFPVTTWTGFGTATDNKGIPIELYFENKTFKPYHNSKMELPIQSYSWIDHKIKDNSFENLNRKDKGHIPELAQYFINKFKNSNPHLKSVNINYIYDGSFQGLNAGVALEDQLNKQFGGYIKINIKGVPSNVFEDYRRKGNYDILYFNYDNYGDDKDSYVKRFFEPDGINKKSKKLYGFSLNPAGSWTYQNYIKSVVDIPKKIKQLNTTQEQWEKFVKLSTKKDDETKIQYSEKINKFFNGLGSDASWVSDEKIMSIIVLLEKIIRDSSPIIPLIEVDTLWSASRVMGAQDLFTFSLQFAYDVNKRPIPGLPGLN